MRILVAYDGSEYADAALDDLKRAGLPATVEAGVITVADVFLPPDHEEVEEPSPYLAEAVRKAHEHAARELKKATELAERTSQRIKKDFPQWQVSAYSCPESPAMGVILKASELDVDLIIAGAHGHSDLGGRLILGSVSQRILYEAACSVRIARRKRSEAESPEDGNAPVRLVIGTDGSRHSDAAVDAVAVRSWPNGSEARLVAATDTVMMLSTSQSESEEPHWFETDNENDVNRLREVFELSANKLRAAGLGTTTEIIKGNPKQVLVTVADEWNADCIFVGAHGIRGLEHLLLGSVSSAVAARAHCSVEVVRPKTNQPVSLSRSDADAHATSS